MANANETYTKIYDTFVNNKKILKAAKSNKKYTFKNNI